MAIKNWNVIISIYQDGYRFARRALRNLGYAGSSPFHNLITVSTDDPVMLLDAVEKKAAENAAFYDAISRIAPALRSFDFH